MCGLYLQITDKEKSIVNFVGQQSDSILLVPHNANDI